MENSIFKKEVGVIFPLHKMNSNNDLIVQESIKRAVNENRLSLEIDQIFEWDNKLYVVKDYQPVSTGNIYQWTYFIEHFS